MKSKKSRGGRRKHTLLIQQLHLSQVVLDHTLDMPVYGHINMLVKAVMGQIFILCHERKKGESNLKYKSD